MVFDLDVEGVHLVVVVTVVEEIPLLGVVVSMASSSGRVLLQKVLALIILNTLLARLLVPLVQLDELGLKELLVLRVLRELVLAEA